MPKKAIKNKKKIMFVTSEAQPFAASGGLGDVAGSLPNELAKNKDVDLRVVMPLYGTIPDEYRSQFTYIGNTRIRMSWRNQYLGLFEYKKDNVTWYFLDNEYYFKRTSIYGYLDEAERFTFLSRGALDIIPMIDFIPSIIHCNDWESALIPVYLKTIYANSDTYKNIRTVFTIHNMEYQGRYGKDILYDLFELPESSFSLVEYDKDVNLMKGAIQCADIVTTVSPTYAKEILTPSASCGLSSINKANEYKIRGILNGIDYNFYNPSTDKNLISNYSKEDISGKKDCKKELQRELNLPEKDVPVVSIISRLVEHKGLDLVIDGAERMLSSDIQLVVLGTGEHRYEEYFKALQGRYNDKVRALIQYNGALSRKIYAGSDLFLMPSKNEPCGLSQMIACRYGALPIVRKVGGLADSIIDVGDDGFGFTFVDFSAESLLDAVRRAEEMYKDKDLWGKTVYTAMETDFSWGASAKRYLEMYDELLSGKI